MLEAMPDPRVTNDLNDPQSKLLKPLDQNADQVGSAMGDGLHAGMHPQHAGMHAGTEGVSGMAWDGLTLLLSHGESPHMPGGRVPSAITP